MNQEYTTWRETVENVFRMHGPKTAIEFIYQPNPDINNQAQKIAEATVQFRSGNLQSAFDLVQSLFHELNNLTDDQQRDVYLILGHYHLESSSGKELATTLENALEAFPNDVLFLILQAKLNNLSASKSIEVSLKEVLEKHPNSVDVLLELANELFQQYKNEEAKNYAVQAFELDPNNTSILNLLGYIELESENDLKAFEYFSKSCEIWPFQIKSQYTLTEVALLLKDSEKTYTCFEYALKYFPNDSKLLLDFAAFLVTSNSIKENEVASHLEQMIAKIPNDASIHHYQAFFLAKLGNNVEALDAIERSIAIQNSDSANKLKVRIQNAIENK